MNKLIIKTAVATLVSILAAGIIALTVLTCFYPKTLADFNYKLGNDKLSVYYSELNYKKTGELEDLEELIYKINNLDEYEKCVTYSQKILEDEGFLEFSKDKEGYKLYVVSEYAVALTKTGLTNEESVERVKQYLEVDEVQFVKTVLDNLK